MPSCIEDEMKGNYVVEDVSGELVDKLGNEVAIPENVTPIPRPQPPLLQRLVKKTGDGKYRHFITMLK